MIETDRLIFRKYTMEDLDFLTSMTSDPDVMKYIGKGTTWTEEFTKERLKLWMSRYEEGHISLMLAIRKSDQAFIGHAGLLPQEVEGQHELEVGYWISKPYWGLGFASEAAIAWKEYGLHQLRKNKLISLIKLGNTGSQNVAKKNGMSLEKQIVFHGVEAEMWSIHR
ncbi:GNAT family N-acetyltransferase [Chengkuizengella axinellae]|uniref:GNAT family N-acetyltransferase n=1 Tax=Chengkuizengella axinellae TaxID=3064388 RepID=A0ABT9J2N8_9BACL|nr:GNAT family N-acetyltransferase [Chengkuizengella sp. 2205SS18-9]MDP5275875.1 GNAT family N-acetyltransferase [Chengkuizengella sp. 2205SS18-9]